ncbi:MAG TPA: DNA recombination protein RmuC [Chryseosolibacter sp.]|nr:DNA recombination protein RmuC [Chryseosolibacter sp.]
MTLVTLLIVIVILLLLLNIWLVSREKKHSEIAALEREIVRISADLARIDPLLRNEFSQNREETQRNAKENREELSNSFKNLSDSLQNAFKDTKDELSRSLKSFEDRFSQNVKDFNELQRQKFDDLLNKQHQIKTENETKLEKIKEAVETNLQRLQEQNSRKLDEMRATVDEKLQSTLEKRFTDSFNLISNRLDQVHQGLGEMQKLASGVGDLKKVLTNVKTRGNLGEIQLGGILEQIFSPEQYEKNSVVKPGTLERVEYAIKLPGRGVDHIPLLLPIDSKFPNEDYQRLVEVYENVTNLTTKEIDDANKQFEYSIKKNAKDIRDKYINPPVTTDFAIMFVPTEGLYAEILRRTGLFEHLQREYRVTVVGPTNLVAFLSSLQMGFKTLAIEKRSSEVWQILGAVKTQFGDFGKILEKTKKKLQEAKNVIDSASQRSRVIERKLRTVQELPSEDSIALLGKSVDVELDEAESVTVDEDSENDPELPF